MDTGFAPLRQATAVFKTRGEADGECLRQKTLLEQHSREAVGLLQRGLSDFIVVRDKLGMFGEMINDAVEFRIDHLERVRCHGITVESLTEELLDTKRKDGRSEI